MLTRVREQGMTLSRMMGEVTFNELEAGMCLCIVVIVEVRESDR